MRRGHRRAHAWVATLGAILAALALAFGWIARSRRPVPEPLAAAEAKAPAPAPAHPDAPPGAAR